MAKPAPAQQPQPDPAGDDAPLDLLIIGAGIAGVGMGVQMHRQLPGKNFLILEQRERAGGTWDLFRYPGVRCDSDFYTLAFNFKPWPSNRSYISGPEIQEYVAQAAQENDLADRIRFQRRVIAANWDSDAGLWQVTVRNEATGQTGHFSTRMLASCAGYYDYDTGYTPDYPGLASFKGKFIHPQQWPADYDYTGKKMVVIGSGATAVTLVPVLAQTAAHVTMLQRSPTWMFVSPSLDPVAMALRKLLPESLAYRLVRLKNIFRQRFTYRLARNKPDLVGGKLMEAVQAELPGYANLERDFKPRYGPWVERLCLVPDSDFFVAMREGKSSVETDDIARFEADGIRLKSGKLLAADAVVSATGLTLAMLGKAQISLDGVAVNIADHVIYRGTMFDGIPNFTFVFGYTNASWTLKADLVAQFTCRLIKAMDSKGATVTWPTPLDPRAERQPFSDFTSGYFARSEAILPRQGPMQPYRINMSYEQDIVGLRMARLEDGTLQFGNPADFRTAIGDHAEDAVAMREAAE